MGIVLALVTFLIAAAFPKPVTELKTVAKTSTEIIKEKRFQLGVNCCCFFLATM